MDRREAVDRLYTHLERLSERIGGPRRLKDCTGYMDWPDRGVYLFLEPGETRASSARPRVTRVGTHAVSAGSGTTLWDRLKQHYGTGSHSSDHPHGGNHRGSVYRLRVGEAIVEQYDLHGEYPTWGTRWSNIDRDRSAVRDEEYVLERRVSAYIREQPFLWLGIDDEPGPESDRAVVERNAIALLSNATDTPIDRRERDWLGHYSASPAIRVSGLWNVEHVEAPFDPAVLETVAAAVERTDPL